jgi:hypothetical protein
MKINLNDPNEFTLSAVRALLASKDDSQHRQIRVTKEGIAFLSDEVGNLNTAGLACRFSTLSMGTDFVGENASKDEKWVRIVYDKLKANWPEPSQNYIEL